MNNRKDNYFKETTDIFYDVFCYIFLLLIFTIHTIALCMQLFHFPIVYDIKVTISVGMLILTILSWIFCNRCNKITFVVFNMLLIFSIFLMIRQYLLIEPPDLVAYPLSPDDPNFYPHRPSNHFFITQNKANKASKVVFTIPFVLYLGYFWLNIQLFFSKKYN